MFDDAFHFEFSFWKLISYLDGKERLVLKAVMLYIQWQRGVKLLVPSL